jgi:hypothetical protein
MMKRLLQKLPIIVLLPAMLCSCIDSGYDLGDLDDSGGFTPALVLPIGTLRTNVMDLIKEAGIANDLIEISNDTIYIVYKGSMSLEPMEAIPGLSNGTIYNIPPGIKFGLLDEEKSIDIDVFDNLASSGSKLYPTNPQVRLDIKNYIGVDLDIKVNGITSYGSDSREKSATFKNEQTTYAINVKGATIAGQPAATVRETFDKDNGKLHELFSIDPYRLSYDFSVDLTVPDDGKSHFIVYGKYIDVNYEIRIPMTFGTGTQLVSADTIDFDLSGDSFVSNLDGLTLWVDYENGIPTTIDLDVLFLDENQHEISGINRKATINASPATTESQTSLGVVTLKFSSDELDTAKEARYIVLKTTLAVKSGSGEVSIRPTDNISLKLSAYSRVNI